MPKPTQSGLSYPGTQSFEGKWAGTGHYPENTLKYFDWYFKDYYGKKSDSSGYMPNEALFEALSSNSPEIKVLDVERRNLDSETMAAITNCLLGNTQVSELKLARNCSFWSEQPDDFGFALVELLKDNKTITKIDLKNDDIHAAPIGALMEVLKTNTTLKWLDLSDNFARECGKQIGEMLKVNKTLTYLNLNVNQLTDDDAEAILAGLAANTTLKEFSGYNNGIINKELRKKFRGFKR